MSVLAGLAVYMAIGIASLYALEGVSALIDRRNGVPRRQRRAVPTAATAETAPGRLPRWLREAGCGAAMLALLGLLWPLLLGFVLWGAVVRGERVLGSEPPEQPFAVAAVHLVEHMTREQIEQRERVVDPLDAVPDRPFGHLHATWQRFAAGLQAGDELWSFRAEDRDRLGALHERRGYVVVRSGRPGAHLLTDWIIREDAAGRPPAER